MVGSMHQTGSVTIDLIYLEQRPMSKLSIGVIDQPRARITDLTLRRVWFLVALTIPVALLGCFNEPDNGEQQRCSAGEVFDAQQELCIDEAETPDAGVQEASDVPGDPSPADTNTVPGTADTDDGLNSGPDDSGDDVSFDPDPDTGSGTSDTGSGTSDTGSGTSDTGGDPDDTGSEEPDPTPEGCSGDSLQDCFSTATVATSGFYNRLFAAAGPDNGAFVASQDDGGIRVIQTSSDGSVLETHNFDGDEIYGLAANDSAFGLLIFRQPDILALLIADHDGSVIEDTTLIGDVDQTEQGSQWFGNLIRDGRLTDTTDGWAAYYTVQQLWPDGVAHYGDQLRTFEADGTPAFSGWDWGCSHSMEVRISHNDDRLGPLCASDCYPTKGVHFNHNGGELWSDEEGSDCAGGYGTSLGASVPINDGFWLSFTATDDRDSHDVAIAQIDGFSVGDTLWLTDDDVDAEHLNTAVYDADLLVAWTTGSTWDSPGTTHFTLRSKNDGSEVSPPQEISGARLSGSSDFFHYSNGDVGWAQSSQDGDIEIVRLSIDS